MSGAYYVVWFKFGEGQWTLADQEAVPNSYESFPRMFMTKRRAVNWAAMFRRGSKNDTGQNYKTAVTRVCVNPPEDK